MWSDYLPGPIRDHLLPFLLEYKDSLTAYWSSALAGIAWISASAFGAPSLMYVAIAFHLLPASFYFGTNRPYGLQIDITPTVEKKGSREPDKMAEKEGKVVMRNRRGTLHAAVDISRYRNDFSLEVQCPPELVVELRDKPRREHEIKREPLTLIGEDITDRDFQVVFEIYLLEPSRPDYEDYTLTFRDGSADRPLEKIRAVAE